MEANEGANRLLKNKYNLHASPEAKTAARRTLNRTGERVPQDPLANIANYLNRFHEITDREDPRDRANGMDAAKRLLYSKFVIKPSEIPEGYFDNQKRLAREQGHGDIDITPEMREQLTDVIITDQKSSLDKWIDYLASDDAPYADSLKYFTIRNVLTMGDYDKEKHAFTQRSKGTTKPFPDLNREALAYVLDAVDKKYSRSSGERGENDPEFEKLLQGENFPKLYAWAIEKVTPASVDSLTNTLGEWVKYDQNSDAAPLVESLQGHGTGWCTAGESTAQAQLQGGDFYVYYSNDSLGKPTIPRAAIRMQQDSIAEVRGIAPEQNLDPYIGDVVESKLTEFPDGEQYKKKAHDMKLLTEVEAKNNAGLDLTSQELTFLYEIDSSIEGFGYGKDPRVAEVRASRNPEEDMLIIFDCQPEQIAHATSQIGPDTRAYVGPLAPGIFPTAKEHNLEHIYTSFPEGKITFDKVTIGGKSKKELESELADKNINISSFAASMMNNPDFETLASPEDLDIVRLHVRDLGINGDYPTTKDVFEQAQALGLELCPPEVGPQYRLQYPDQPMDEWFLIGMKPITGSNGNPSVFRLARVANGLWLRSYWAKPGNEWDPDYEFVFSLSKSSQLDTKTPGLLNRVFKR